MSPRRQSAIKSSMPRSRRVIDTAPAGQPPGTMEQIPSCTSRLPVRPAGRRAAGLDSMMMRAAFATALLVAASAEEHDEPGHAGHAGAGPTETQHAGGHSGDLWKTQQCIPVSCDAEDDSHGAETSAAMREGCREYSVYNFMKHENETLRLTCQGCVPTTCGFGEHDCVPNVCMGEEGEHTDAHHSNPCEGGHHADDGLAWWPFLLICLVSTVGVTSCLQKLGNGACCGKSLNPPFTVVMFFFGYACSALAVHDDLEDMRETMDEHHPFSSTEILFESVVAWKSAHPHVILFVLLPPLLFEDSSGMDYYVFRKVLMSSILLAGPGVGISMLLTALTTMALFGFAEECTVEIDPHTKEQIVSGAKDFYERDLDGIPNRRVCDPRDNPNWQSYNDSEGFYPCIECSKDAWKEEQLPISVHLLLGGMLAATDPVAVCAVLNDLGCPDKLNFMIAGESLLNDGTAVVAFMVMQGVAGGCETTAAKVMISLIRLAGGGVLWGMFMAATAYNFIKHLRDPNIEITTLVFCTMTCFWVAENIIGVSGVLGTVVFGVQTARTSFLAMDEHTHHANHAFWGEVGYVATSMIFILAGVKSRDKIASFLDNFAEDFDEAHREGICAAFNPGCAVDGAGYEGEGIPWHNGEEICADVDEQTEQECISHHVCLWKHPIDDAACAVGSSCCIQADITGDDDFHMGNQLALNFVLWIVLGFIRAFVVFCLSPALKNLGYGLTAKEAAVMVWGGLRGAVSLSLALLIDGNHLIGNRARETIFLQTTGIVTLTLVINGTTSGMVYKALQVYPPNPFRPVLATQGLRNLQIEMDKFVSKLAGHWFHSNADQEALSKLMPNFAEAHMYDGDLVDVKMESMHSVWSSTLSAGSILSPQRLTLNAAEGIRGGLRNGIKIMRMGYTPRDEQELGSSSKPDAYAEIVISKGAAYQTYETGIVKNDDNPVWQENNSKIFKILPGAEPVELYVHMFDNDLGEIDEYIGQAFEDITDETGSKTITAELTPCTHAVKEREYDGKLPYEVAGSVTFEVACSDDEVTVTLTKATGIGGSGVKTGSPELAAAEHDPEGDHDHDHAHGHGHGAGHVTMLKNVKRWLDESKEDVESSYAMYDVMLSTMKTSFMHELEGKILSVAAFSKLNAATGIALDLNNSQMEGSLAVKMDQASSEGASTATIATWQKLKPEEWETPVDAAVNYVIDFCENGEAWIQHPAAFFHHRLLCAEMLLTLVGQLKQLSDVDLSDLGPAFGPNTKKACARAKIKLAEMQSLAPNTFSAVHTIIAFKVVAAEFHHRVHIYQDQGFFIDTLVSGAEYVMEGREQEVQQYVNIDPLVTMLGYVSKFVCMKDHPVVYMFERDKDGLDLDDSSKGTQNPVSADEEADDSED